MQEIPLDFDPNQFLAGALVVLGLAGVSVFYLRARIMTCLRRVNSFFTLPGVPKTGTLWSLFLVSFAALYFEIMMIRWIATEVRIFAYFQNLVLIACFLGFGLGCYLSDREKSLLLPLAATTLLLLLVQAPVSMWKLFLLGLSNLLSLSPDSALWGHVYQLGTETQVLLLATSVLAVAAFLILQVLVMVPLGQWVGYLLDRAPNPVKAYSVNLLGSLAGIWVFAAMAFLWLTPEYWFGFALFLLLIIRPPSRRFTVAVLLALVGSVTWLHLSREPTLRTYWSPYQKLQVQSLNDGQYSVDVNNTGYMSMANMQSAFLARHPEIARNYHIQSAYDAPFRFAKSCRRVLIVGAGAGNDAAGALRNGAESVDAVEIDPAIFYLGEELHPDHPYASPKVHPILNDARAFLRRAREQYDVIIFGLLDSHTEFSGYSNLRVDNYVYTEESFREAKRLLGPGGILVVKFEVRAPWTWMGERFYKMLNDVFGRAPITFYAPYLGELTSGTIFITSQDVGLWTRATQEPLATLIAQNPPSFSLQAAGRLPVATDDWPYVYNRSRNIPTTYFTVSLIVLLIAVLLMRGRVDPRRSSTWLFFSLGAGFLLLETQLISRLALYFGTTWLVNCVALTVLLLVLVLANIYVARGRPNHLKSYSVLLLAALVGTYLFPWGSLPYKSGTVGTLLSLAYASAVFCAGVIFTEMFRRCEHRAGAFGANILGAVAGGLVQNASFVVGMKALLLIAAVFYAFATVCEVLERRPAQAVGALVSGLTSRL